VARAEERNYRDWRAQSLETGRPAVASARLRAKSRHGAQTAIASQQVWRITSHSCGLPQTAQGSSPGANGDGVTVMPGS